MQLVRIGIPDGVVISSGSNPDDREDAEREASGHLLRLHPEDQDIFRRVKTPIEMVDGTSNTAHARTAAQEFSDEVPETKAGQVVLTPP
jgi:hypothetical protein